MVKQISKKMLQSDKIKFVSLPISILKKSKNVKYCFLSTAVAQHSSCSEVGYYVAHLIVLIAVVNAEFLDVEGYQRKLSKKMLVLSMLIQTFLLLSVEKLSFALLRFGFSLE